MLTHTLLIEIPFFDVDVMRIVWHGHYVKYFEQARCALLASLGFTYKDMAAAGFAFPVVSLKIKYMRPCVFGQKIAVKATLEPCENCLIVSYVITDEKTGQKLCKGETRQMAVLMATKETLYELPAVLLEKVKALS